MGFFRKIIKITAEDSPNVRYARAEIAAGREPTNKIIVPGVLTWDEYQHRLRTWDEARQKVGLNAEFVEDETIFLYPPDWLLRSKARALFLQKIQMPRIAKAVGIDPGEGGANTAWTAVDEFGIIEQIAKKTANTAVIPTDTIEFGTRHNVPPEKWIFDRGGGGKQHADRLRMQGFMVQTVGFGESIMEDIKKSESMKLGYKKRLDMREERYAYVDRRSQMAWFLRERLDPSLNPVGFAIHPKYDRLFQSLSPIPLTRDKEGRFKLLPKYKRNPTDTLMTLTELIGFSPDEYDSLILAIYGMTTKVYRSSAGFV